MPPRSASDRGAGPRGGGPNTRGRGAARGGVRVAISGELYLASIYWVFS
jgi:hypothetical protein